SAIVSVVIGLAALLLGLPLVFTIMVVNFVGGYIPYIGAFLGGGLAVIIALGDGGLGTAAVMLVVVLAANLLLENFVEPKVMGRTLDIHPLAVLVVTALGGLLGGIVGPPAIQRLPGPGRRTCRADRTPHPQLSRRRLTP
ncbi:MAG TPA: AI-2E family transporter, partial [Actinomycetota bacterium]|nr:AI-2E family transporter [Actinomycetota bacterium]